MHQSTSGLFRALFNQPSCAGMDAEIILCCRNSQCTYRCQRSERGTEKYSILNADLITINDVSSNSEKDAGEKKYPNLIFFEPVFEESAWDSSQCRQQGLLNECKSPPCISSQSTVQVTPPKAQSIQSEPTQPYLLHPHSLRSLQATVTHLQVQILFSLKSLDREKNKRLTTQVRRESCLQYMNYPFLSLLQTVFLLYNTHFHGMTVAERIFGFQG